MDKIIYDNKLSDTIKMWYGVAGYTKLDYFPFNEIEVDVYDGGKSNVNIIFKGNRIITTANNHRQVSYIELKDGKIESVRISYTDLNGKNTIQEIERVSTTVITNIFTFVANYNLPQNSTARSIFAMRELMYGNIRAPHIGVKNVKSNKSKKLRKNTQTLLNLVDTAKLYKSKDGEKRAYNRTCPAWNVKGFPRKLASGKIINVKPFTKGKNKNDIQDKVYKL